MGDKIRVMYSEKEVDKRIRELGEQISKRYEGKTVHMICVLKGGVFFMCELAKRITVPVTMDFMKILNERKPSSICLCTLLDKPERREVDDVNVDYTGFQVPDEFVVGYGLDYDQLYRNLPYVGVVETE